MCNSESPLHLKENCYEQFHFVSSANSIIDFISMKMLMQLGREVLKNMTTTLKWVRPSSSPLSQKCGVEGNLDGKDRMQYIRNIGVLAHIDAGKTTTTERMLYYCGKIKKMGEVHRGTTVTDYMAEERERGITISSSAVTINWKSHRINLVDTPGHIDFTVEVERTLNVLDGAVIVLDGSAGVEAQTTTVWGQADRYRIPRILYVNKMDRGDADLEMCLRSLKEKLDVNPLPLQLPVYDAKQTICGLVDLLTLQVLTWDKESQGKMYFRRALEENVDGFLWECSIAARIRLTENLADMDDKLADLVIDEECLDFVPGEFLAESIQKATCDQKGVPVLCGSSYKNMGVQPLLDAVVRYLPSPDKRNKQLLNCFEDTLCARAFKVIHDEQKKPVTFFRIYTGKFTQGQKIYNINQEKPDQIGKLMVAFADENMEVPEIGCGNIAAVTGLKFTASGDFVTASSSSAISAKKKMASYECSDEEDIFGQSMEIPLPVFFCSIEPPSQAYQQELEKALHELQREDPSLIVKHSSETGQTILGGMGELHLEIIKNRIVSEYKIDVELGSLQVAYREAILSSNSYTFNLTHTIGSSKHSTEVSLTAMVNKNMRDTDIFILDRSPHYAANLATISPKNLQAIKRGIESALMHGPKLSCPVVDVKIILHYLNVGKGTSDSIVAAASRECTFQAICKSGTHLVEPIMQLQIVTNSDVFSVVMVDLSRRRGVVTHILHKGVNKVITAHVPLSELLGYSTVLRTLTSGSSSFNMEFHSYQPMPPAVEAKAIKNITGFDQ